MKSLMALLLWSSTAAARFAPHYPCRANHDCVSHVCSAKSHRCIGPPVLTVRQPCGDDRDCRSRHCGLNPRLDWPGGTRCLPATPAERSGIPVSP